MVDDKQNKNGDNDNISKKPLENLSDFLAEKDLKQQGIYVMSDYIAKTSQPVDEDSDVQEQLDYASEKIEQYYKDKAKEKALGLKSDAHDIEALPLHQKDGDIRLSTLRVLLSKSALGEALLKGHEHDQVELAIDNQIYTVQLHRQSNLIGLNHQMTYGEAIFLVARELRRAWLSMEGDVLYPLAYLPDDAILMNRILEADCRMVGIWVAWELKLQGFDGAWEYLLGSDEAVMARSFARKAREDFRNLDNGEAARAAFDSWFSSAIVKKTDHGLIQQMLADEKGYVFSSEEPPQIITASLVDFIGEMPLGRNYMVGLSDKPLPDTEYAAVKDRSNANFLWFVKFEKSFQDTEKEIIEQERQEKQRQKNIEHSLQSDFDIQALAAEDEKIIDFSSHFRQKLIDDNSSRFYDNELGDTDFELLGQEAQEESDISADVHYIFPQNQPADE